MRRSLDAPLGDQLRHVLARAHNEKWTIDRAGNGCYVVTSPTGSIVNFGKNSSRGNIYAEFRRAGLEVDPKRIHQPRFRPRTEKVDENSTPFASLSFMLDVVQQLPLVEDIPESVQRRWTFSDHALGRLTLRNIGVFEVWSALHEPAFRIPELDRPNMVHYLRGDVEVVVDEPRATIVTVIDMLETTRTEPRIALAPIVPAPKETTAPQEITVPVHEEDPAFHEPPSESTESTEPIIEAPPEFPKLQKTAAMRDWLKARPIGTEFTVSELAQATGVLTQTVMSVTSVWTKRGALKHIGVGTYRLLSKTKLDPQKRGFLRGQRAEHSSRPKLIDRMRERIAADPPGTEYTNGALAKEMGVVYSATRTKLLELEAEGLLTKRVSNGMWVYTRAVESAEPAQRKARAKDTTVYLGPNGDPRETDGEDGYEVTVGFAVETLPRSDLWDLIDVVGYHLAELKAGAGTWARIATYSGATAHEVASKRAGRLDNELRNPNLRFQVRRISQAEVGLFISWVAG